MDRGADNNQGAWQGQATIEGRACEGHTLLELLVVVAVLGVAALLPLLTLTRVLDTVGARGAAQTWQGAAVLAQSSALWTGGPVGVAAGSDRIAVDAGTGALDLGSADGLAVRTNFPHWVQPSGTRVSFDGAFGSPDGAGSITFGEPEWGTRVVVRLETGTTRRSRP